MIGEVHTVYPREGMDHIMVQGQRVTAQGAAMTITRELLALEKARFIRIDTGAAPAPHPAPPAPPPMPPPAPPQPDPHALDIDTPAAQSAPPEAPAPDDPRARKLAEINQMNNEELRQFVESIGQDAQGKRRGSLLQLARTHVQNMPADQLV
jgi:hypothetical protein